MSIRNNVGATNTTQEYLNATDLNTPALAVGVLK